MEIYGHTTENYKKEMNTDTSYNTDESWKHYDK